ncbi:MAG TPA: ABC transporter permease [Thermoplasmata archaeon]|nr:ABC transporter permease [Thermoplasmata archaeon]
MSLMRTVRQTVDATLMAYRSASRDLGLLLAFIILFPIGFLFFLGQIVAPAQRPHVLVGSIMMEMALLNINVIAQSIGQDKESKLYDLWVSLPMSPVVYVTSLALSFLPFSLLSAGITLAVGAVWFGIGAFSIGVLLAALLLVWASTLGIGFLVGVYGTSPRQINTSAQFVGIVMTFFAPVFYPVTALPVALQYLAYAWPLTWGAILLQAILTGSATGVLAAGGVLAVFAVAWVVLIGIGLRWRQV